MSCRRGARAETAGDLLLGRADEVDTCFLGWRSWTSAEIGWCGVLKYRDRGCWPWAEPCDEVTV